MENRLSNLSTLLDSDLAAYLSDAPSANRMKELIKKAWDNALLKQKLDYAYQRILDVLIFGETPERVLGSLDLKLVIVHPKSADPNPRAQDEYGLYPTLSHLAAKFLMLVDCSPEAGQFVRDAIIDWPEGKNFPVPSEGVI